MYIVLFPSTLNSSAELTQNQEIQIPGKQWIKFDKEQGTEKLWLVFSPKSVPQLEAAKLVANPQQKGVLEEPELIDSVAAFFQNDSGNKTVSEKNMEQKLTQLKASGERLVYPLLLEHN